MSGSDGLGGRGAGVVRSTSLGGPGVAPAPAAGYVAPTASPPALPPHAGTVTLPQAQHPPYPQPQQHLPAPGINTAPTSGEGPQQPQHPYPHSYYPPGPHYNYPPAAPGQVAKPEDLNAHTQQQPTQPPTLPQPQAQAQQPSQAPIPQATPQSGGRLIEQMLQQQQQPPALPSHPQLPQPNLPPQPSPKQSPPQAAPSPQVPQPSPPQPSPPQPQAQPQPAKKGPHYEKEAGAILFNFAKNKDSEEEKATSEDPVKTKSPKKDDGDESYPIDYAIGIALRFHILVPLFQNSVSSQEGPNDLVDVAKFCGRYCRGDTVYVTKEGTGTDGDGDTEVACRIEQCTLKDATLFEAWYQHDKHLPHTSATWNQWWKTQCGNPDPNCEMVKLISPKPPRTADQGVNLDADDEDEEKELVLGVAYYERSIVDSIPLLPKESDDGTKRIVATSLLRGIRLNPLYNPELKARYTDVEPPAHTPPSHVYRGIEKCLFTAVLLKSLYYNTKTMAVNSRKSSSQETFWKEQCNMGFITVDSHDEDGRRYYRLTGNDRWEYLRTEFKKQWDIHESVLKTKKAAAIVVKDEVLPPTTTTIAKSPDGSPKVEAIPTEAEPNGTAAATTTATSVIDSKDAAEQTKSLTPSTVPAFSVDIAKDDPMDMDIVPNDDKPNDPKAPAPSPDEPASPEDPTNNSTHTIVDTAAEGNKRIRDTEETGAATSTAADTGAVSDPEPPCKKIKTEPANTAISIAATAAANAAGAIQDAIQNTTEAPKPAAAVIPPKQLSETASAPTPPETADATTNPDKPASNPDKPAATVPQSLPITPIKKEDKHTEGVEDMNATVLAL
eukprot:CAMPEP_0194362430 /NCGR_PEP_ID=MMETSP0174-20130528/10168_1 /TAXON_ID=216777 /ORGANISM="Proboscia alata, Strain PI-D3" /LENGTH=834 /DNA_ID=CAMNT_0039135291 /DNA_START=231 /DNA_END=2735 /DNA_ORIENTATION=+